MSLGYSSKTLTWILAVTFMAFLSACNGQMEKPEDKEDEEKEEIAIPVESGKVTRGSITAFFPSTTTLESEQEASVVAKVGGIVEKYFVEEGDQVKAGQPLVQLESDRLRLELRRSEASLNKLKNDLKRTRAIYKKNLVSSETFDKLKYEYDSQQAAYELSKLELTFATVVAPIDGIISTRHIKVGNMVRINDAVYHITDFDPIHAVIYIPERELYKIKLNQLAMIKVDANKENVYQGFVKRISPIVDADSGTFKVTVEVSDPEHNLRPGMFGRLKIIHAVHDNALLIAKKALLIEDTQTSVFVIKDSRVIKKLVQTGFVNDKMIEILSGLEDQDIIVITGQNSLKHDALIEVLSASKTNDSTKTSEE